MNRLATTHSEKSNNQNFLAPMTRGPRRRTRADPVSSKFWGRHNA